MRMKCHFELEDGTRVGSWEYRVLKGEETLSIGDLIVVGGKRFTIVGYKRPVDYAEAWDRIIRVAAC
jgi:hypothetical protein